ncbi:hypothetical protein CJ030_MR6G025619 [Morella rubra]|uniref:Protein kinase domain-containing protein n=1 Tax=Morella rubra TaxID=262757 RepID=A0A6A1VFX0_9ROSI|nr:hypothetical protein CJ030_MR6G025619 [Morella rubra]
MAYLCLLLLVVLFSPSACQLQNSQTQILLQLRKQLEYPSSLQILENFDGDFCSLSSSAYMSISCEESSVTELKIMGDKLAKVSGFNGFAIPNKTLSESFSIDSFVTTLTRLPSLRVLSLVSLGIWGPLPDKIHRLSSLELLDLSSNFMYGSIPPGISRLAMLHTLTLDGNYFNDTLPGWLDSFSNLTILSLKSNVLKGQIPSSVSKVRTLTDLALSHNELSGKLPDLSTLTSLQVLDLRENHLDSELPVMPKVLVTALLNKNSFSGKILLGVLFLLRRCRLRRMHEQHLLPKIVQDNAPTGVSSELLANARFISQAAKLGTQGAPVCRLFAFEELKEATNGFDSARFLGEGSMGKLYRGCLENGTSVAIRSLSLVKKCSTQNLRVRLDLLSKLHHPHLVGLLGHCIDANGQDDSKGNKVFLVYEYVPNGNYRTHLSGSSLIQEHIYMYAENSAEQVLKWLFQHRLKTNNILLDDHRIAKLSDYGMSILIEEIEKSEVKGEGPKSCHQTNGQDDVYNFGLILLESLVGPVVTGKGEVFLQNEMASFGSQDGRRRIVDPIVLTTSSQESLSIVISITNKCISPDRSSRPSFEDVLWNSYSKAPPLMLIRSQILHHSC